MSSTQLNKSNYNDMTYSDYVRLSAEDSVKVNIDRSAKQQLLASMIIKGSNEDNSILKETLENQFSLGIDNYPSTTTKAMDMPNHFKGSCKGGMKGASNNK